MLTTTCKRLRDYILFIFPVISYADMGDEDYRALEHSMISRASLACRRARKAASDPPDRAFTTAFVKASELHKYNKVK